MWHVLHAPILLLESKQYWRCPFSGCVLDWQLLELQLLCDWKEFLALLLYSPMLMLLLAEREELPP